MEWNVEFLWRERDRQTEVGRENGGRESDYVRVWRFHGEEDRKEEGGKKKERRAGRKREREGKGGNEGGREEREIEKQRQTHTEREWDFFSH